VSNQPPFPRYPDPLRIWRRLAPERVALADRVLDNRATYAELDTDAARWTALLEQLSVRRGDRVAAITGNRVELIALFFACGRVGAMLVPLNWRLAPPELARIIGNAGPRVIVGEERFRTAAELAVGASGLPASHEPRWVDLDAEAAPLLRRLDPSATALAPDPEDGALVLYTSGSTGHPKGAVLPHRQLFYNALATCIGWELGSADVAPISTPLFHTGGWNVFALPLWQRGGRVVLLDHFDPNAFLEVMAEERCTVALTVPTQLLMLTESASWGTPLPSLRYFISGGAACPKTLAARVRDCGYLFREGYGLTECGPNCFAMPGDQATRRPGSVGWPMPFLEMRLVRDDGCTVGEHETGVPGELWVRGPQRFTGYLDDPVRTRETITPDGWLRTGDLATRDADGAYSICGRRKEMFISGGENIFPAEVEAALADCSGVSEVVVVGVHDARWGEVGRAFVVRRPGAELTEGAVLAHARQRLARYKVPKSVIFLEAIPRLGSGKPDRRALATMERSEVP
jgi:fatty-acyl-CoA synthase